MKNIFQVHCKRDYLKFGDLPVQHECSEPGYEGHELSLLVGGVVGQGGAPDFDTRWQQQPAGQPDSGTSPLRGGSHHQTVVSEGQLQQVGTHTVDLKRTRNKCL